MTVKRATRVGEGLRAELARLVRGLSDPRLTNAMVSRVDMTDDLSIARVYVRRLTGTEDQKGERALLAAFRAAAQKLRREVGAVMRLRSTPELRFFYDAAPDTVDRIEELLAEVERDRKPGS